MTQLIASRQFWWHPEAAATSASCNVMLLMNSVWKCSRVKFLLYFWGICTFYAGHPNVQSHVGVWRAFFLQTIYFRRKEMNNKEKAYKNCLELRHFPANTFQRLLYYLCNWQELSECKGSKHRYKGLDKISFAETACYTCKRYI